MRILPLVLTSFLWAACVQGSSHAILKSGFRIIAETIEKTDTCYRLQTGGGLIEVPLAEVIEIERDDYVAPAPVLATAAMVALPRPPQSVPQMITEAAMRAGIPPEFVHSVAKAESNYETKALSPKGAIGVMQLMPATAAALNADPHDPQQNIEAGARYLRDLLVRYDGDSVKALAAYNAGPAAVDRYQGVPPYRETVTYVDRVLRNYQRLTAAAGSPSR